MAAEPSAGAEPDAGARTAPPRLSPEHYEPVRVPPEVRCHAGRPDTLGVGLPGKIGLLELGFEKPADRTELVAHYQKSPLQIMRPLYYDPHRPDMAITFLMATGGGIVQGDRLRMDLRCGPDTAVHFTTQAATKVHGMEHDYAVQQVNLTAGPGAYVEYLPEMTIPYKNSRFYQRTVLTLDPTATVLAAETLMTGRLARGERNAYDIFATDLELRWPDGQLVALDVVRLDPKTSPGVSGPAVLAGHDLMAGFFAVSPLAPARDIADALHGALAESGLLFGVSVLPQDCGAWLRVLGSDPIAVTAATECAWDAVRRLLTGTPAPKLRKA
ncbi:urease accessory protein UreD [Streptomyces sp. NPDC050658]|uniref:urease accessory protein UreD n=1 Tax=unclassified Streptomyces TaxID=2593676 RepID=UPI003443BB8F